MPCRVLVRLKQLLNKEEFEKNKDELKELLSKDLLIGYVYDYEGESQCFYFEKNPSNIANFIMLHQVNTDTIILTDMMDRMILHTFGEFIDQCPDQELLQKVLKELIPIQFGEKEAENISLASADEAQAIWDAEETAGLESDFYMT